ncbi:MAG: SDR family oxidoreductase [Bdellovibrionota bacterium]
MAEIKGLNQNQTPPPQTQSKQPGSERKMHPRPLDEKSDYRASAKLEGKVALITGGDSGIGRAVALLYAKEGADISIIYLNEHDDAKETQKRVEALGRRCLLISGDVGDERFCGQSVEETVNRLGHLDILVNNAAEQHTQAKLEDISAEQLEKTFRTNIFGYVYMAKAALKHLPQRGSIINTASITAFRGKPNLIDYSATKGAIVAFTRSLSQSLREKQIRVNAVAPGPVWTPLIPSSFDKKEVSEFGENTFLGRPAEPSEIAPCYVFLASDADSLLMTGQTLHPNGGEVIAA